MGADRGKARTLRRLRVVVVHGHLRPAAHQPDRLHPASVARVRPCVARAATHRRHVVGATSVSKRDGCAHARCCAHRRRARSPQQAVPPRARGRYGRGGEGSPSRRREPAVPHCIPRAAARHVDRETLRLHRPSCRHRGRAIHRHAHRLRLDHRRPVLQRALPRFPDRARSLRCAVVSGRRAEDVQVFRAPVRWREADRESHDPGEPSAHVSGRSYLPDLVGVGAGHQAHAAREGLVRRADDLPSPARSLARGGQDPRDDSAADGFRHELPARFRT